MRTSYYKHHIHNSPSPANWNKIWRTETIESKQKSKNMPNDDAQKHVHFSNVTVREYEIRPSDTPAVSSGAGIELGWNYKILLDTFPLIDFDEVRIKQRRKYFQYSSGLSPLQRRVRLSEFGFSKEEIDEASNRSAKLRRSNEKSIRRMKFDRIAELSEDFGRNWRNLKVKMGISLEPESRADLQNDNK